jgi:hypothetical protein
VISQERIATGIVDKTLYTAEIAAHELSTLEWAAF